MNFSHTPVDMSIILFLALLLLLSFKLESALVSYTVYDLHSETTAQAIQTIIKTCADVEQIDLKDLPHLATASEEAVSKDYKCFIKCEYEAIGILSMGKLDTHELMYSQDPNIVIVTNCNNDIHRKGYDVEDECDFGFKLGRCISKGLKPLLKQEEIQRNTVKANCASIAGFNLSELQQLKMHDYKNAERPFKCYQNCMFEHNQILLNGRLNRAIFEEKNNDNALYNHVKECHVDIFENGFKANPEKCELAYQMLLCLTVFHTEEFW